MQRIVTITFSSPYHHQTNSPADRAVGICKSLWKKAVESNKCPYTALWMYRVTPLDNHLPSLYELLYGHKPKSLIPSSKKNLQSRHPDNENNQEKNYERQPRQGDTYDRKAGIDKRILNNTEPVHVRNTIKKVSEPCAILNRQNPIRDPIILYDINGRTREHLKPRSNNMPREVNEHFEPPVQQFISMPSTPDIPSLSPVKSSTK